MKTKWGIVPTGAVLSSEWAWILEHADLIEKHSWIGIRGTPLELEDFRAALVTDLATTFDQFNPTRGSAKTWIAMRRQRVRRTLVRWNVRNGGAELSPETDPAPPGSIGSSDRSMARAELALLFARANSRQRAAIVSIAKDWPAPKVRKTLGWTLKQRDAAVAAFVKECAG